MKNEATAKAAVVSKQSSGAWDDAAFAQLRKWDPAWADACGKMATNPWTSGILPHKAIELICIALDASYTHMYAPGTRRHIQAALKLGATVEEIMEVLKLCVAQGVQACNLGVPALAEELKRTSAKPK
jgi:alkylhydroperoxidase/carboxymuconolactone decarboxylase family protein YurZ